MPGLIGVIQSPHTPPDKIMGHLKRFFESFEARSTHNLEQVKLSVTKSIIELPQTQADMVSEFWYQILLREMSFDQRLRLTQAVQKVTINDVKRYYQSRFLNRHSSMVFFVGDDMVYEQKTNQPLKDSSSFKQKSPKLMFK